MNEAMPSSTTFSLATAFVSNDSTQILHEQVPRPLKRKGTAHEYVTAALIEIKCVAWLACKLCCGVAARRTEKWLLLAAPSAPALLAQLLL